MAFKPNNPMPNKDKIDLVINGMKAGRTRDELAGRLGYQSYKSLHNFMTRKGCHWDGIQYRYRTPKQRHVEKGPMVPEIIRRIQFLFDQPLANADDIAREVKLRGGRQELAQFMRARNYRWDPTRNNYVHERDLGQKPIAQPGSEVDPEPPPTAYANGGQLGFIDPGLQALLPLLERLQPNNSPNDPSFEQQEGSPDYLPRYVVQGVVSRKTIQLVSDLGDLMRSYSNEYRISQRAVIEIALVEFFRKYGYEDEVNAIIK